MYRNTNRQASLFGVDTLMGDSARRRLEESWAHLFVQEIYPILLDVEGKFAHLYSDTGQPNRSVARLLGVCILKELEDLTDQQAVDALTFDARWRYALGFEADEDSYLSRQGLVEFRSRIVRADPEADLLAEVFQRVTSAALQRLGLSSSTQRIDSSLIQSNIRRAGRVDLLVTTLRHALAAVRKVDATALQRLSEPLRTWFEGKDQERGWFGNSGARVALQQVGEWLFEIAHHFAEDAVLGQLEAVQLAVRVLHQHFELEPNPGPGGGKPRTNPREHAVKAGHSTTLQSPHDPDAGQGHKGIGYMAHIAETCGNSTTELITGYMLNPANQADQNQAAPMLVKLEKNAIRPDTLYGDGGYITPISMEEAANGGTRLIGPIPGAGKGFDRLDFEYDEDGLVLSCPEGHGPIGHRDRKYEDDPGTVTHAFFEPSTCHECPHRAQCPVRLKDSAALLPLVPRLVVRDQRLREQREDAWWDEYSIRSGIEATFSELKRAHGCRRLRVRRRPRMMLALSFKVTACNVKRWARTAA